MPTADGDGRVSSAEEDRRRVQRLMTESTAELAEAEIRALAAMHPDDRWFTRVLVSVLWDRGAHQEARDMLKIELAQTPESRDLKKALVRVHQMSGEYDLAAIVAENLLGNDPDDSEARYMLGWSRVSQGRHEEALGVLRSIAFGSLHDGRARRLYWQAYFRQHQGALVLIFVVLALASGVLGLGNRAIPGLGLLSLAWIPLVALGTAIRGARGFARMILLGLASVAGYWLLWRVLSG